MWERIHIEIANVPAYTSEVRKLRANYEFLPDGYTDLLIVVESLDEIMADKLLALAASQKRVRHRDIWDLAWLRQRGAEVRPYAGSRFSRATSDGGFRRCASTADAQP